MVSPGDKRAWKDLHMDSSQHILPRCTMDGSLHETESLICQVLKIPASMTVWEGSALGLKKKLEEMLDWEFFSRPC